MSELMTEFCKPELLVLVPVLNALGAALKRGRVCRDERIPAVLGGAGILLAAVWVLANQPPLAPADAWAAVFTAVVQGVLCAAGAVYANQLMRQQKHLADGTALVADRPTGQAGAGEGAGEDRR